MEYTQQLFRELSNICIDSIGSEFDMCEDASKEVGSEATHSCTLTGDLGRIVAAFCLELNLHSSSLVQRLWLTWRGRQKMFVIKLRI